MSDITINIRASADPSLRNAFRPLEESVRRGRAMVAREVDGMTSDRTAAVRRASSLQAENALIVQRASRFFVRAHADFEAKTEPLWRSLPRPADAHVPRLRPGHRVTPKTDIIRKT